jgi:hypothetical protein
MIRKAPGPASKQVSNHRLQSTVDEKAHLKQNSRGTVMAKPAAKAL